MTIALRAHPQQKPIEPRNSKERISNHSNPQKEGTKTMSWQDTLFFPGVIPQIAGVVVWVYGLGTRDLGIQILGGALIFVPIALHIVPLLWRDQAVSE